MGSTHSLRFLYLLQRWFSKTSIKSTATPKFALQPETWLLRSQSSLSLTEKCDLMLIATEPIIYELNLWRSVDVPRGTKTLQTERNLINTPYFSSSPEVGLFPILHNYFGGIFPESCNNLRKFTTHETKKTASLFW